MKASRPAGETDGPERLLRFCSTRGVRLTRLKAAEIVGAARVAFAMPETMSAVRLRILMADMELLAKLDQEISETEEQLAEILPETPADILTTLPRVSVVRGSNYGEALGDITRFRHAGQAYRLSGLVPRRYESAGKSGPPPRSRARERSATRGDPGARQGAASGPSELHPLRRVAQRARQSRRGDPVRGGSASQPPRVRHDARPDAFRSFSLVSGC